MSTTTKITGLTALNVRAIRETIPADLGVTTTASTATFSMSPQDALHLVEATISRLHHRGHPRQSLHAVRRKLLRASGAGLPGRDYSIRVDGQPVDPYSGGELEL